MKSQRALASFALIVLVGCAGQPYLTEGDAADGRTAFMELGCHTCHRVSGQDFPDPVADPPVPVVLASPDDKKAPWYLAESIIAPSHQFARPRPEYLATDPPIRVERQYENIGEGGESRMGSYNDNLTVRQWLDLVSFLDAVQNGE